MNTHAHEGEAVEAESADRLIRDYAVGFGHNDAHHRWHIYQGHGNSEDQYEPCDECRRRQGEYDRAREALFDALTTAARLRADLDAANAEVEPSIVNALGLNSLPVGAVVLDRGGDAWQKTDAGWNCAVHASNTEGQSAHTLAVILGPLTPLAANRTVVEQAATIEAVRALADEWDRTTYKLPPGYPMTVNEFCGVWFKRPLRAVLPSTTPPTPGIARESGGES